MNKFNFYFDGEEISASEGDSVAAASTATHETTLFHRHCATDGLRLCGLATVALPSSSHRQQAALALQMDSLGDIYSWSIQLDSFGKPEVCADSPEAPPAAQQNQTAAPLRAAGFERTAEAIKELESRVQDRVPRRDRRDLVGQAGATGAGEPPAPGLAAYRP